MRFYDCATGQELTVDGDSITVGRVEGNDLKLPPGHEREERYGIIVARLAMTISRRHARISREGSEVYIEDVGSTYGTRVNGKDVPVNEKMRVNTDDTIQLGRYDIQLLGD